MREQRVIFRMKHGSHLYGTNTPDSDNDYKEIHLPSGRDILLGRTVNAVEVVHREKTQNEKNGPDDIDTQCFTPIKLFDMLEYGDIIGCELIFPSHSSIEVCEPEYANILMNRREYLSKNVRGYLGYCRMQASKYSIRGERVNAIRKLTVFLASMIETYSTQTTIGEIENHIQDYLVKSPNRFTKIVSETLKNDRVVTYLECCNRKAQYGASIKIAHGIFQRTLDEYGQRALAAESNNGVDWKAVSHAIRVGNQAIELLDTGKITFPRPEAEYLLDIKLGRLKYKDVSWHLEELLDKVEHSAANSKLPEAANREYMDSLLLDLYKKQVI